MIGKLFYYVVVVPVAYVVFTGWAVYDTWRNRVRPPA